MPRYSGLVSDTSLESQIAAHSRWLRSAAGLTSAHQSGQLRYDLNVVPCGQRKGGRIALALSICSLALVGCLTAGVPEGLACSESGSCPVDQVCVDAVCILAGTNGPDTEIDAGDVVVPPDANRLDADNSCIDSVKCGDVCEAQCVTNLTTAGESTFQPQVGCTYLRVEAWGAGGGHGDRSLETGAGGAGAGGYALRELDVTSADAYTVVVGAPGTNAVGETPGIGGIPGGGNGGLGEQRSGGGGGGGFSGLFSGAVALGNALVIGGGGGGSGGGPARPDLTHGGAGGGEEGQFGSDEATGSGGTQAAGNAQLAGGPGGADNDGGGGGGAGYWGGQGGNGANDEGQGGGGGSGYDGTAACGGCETGDRIIPGNPLGMIGETNGLPTLPGKVTLTCFPAAPTP